MKHIDIKKLLNNQLPYVDGLKPLEAQKMYLLLN